MPDTTQQHTVTLDGVTAHVTRVHDHPVTTWEVVLEIPGSTRPFLFEKNCGLWYAPDERHGTVECGPFERAVLERVIDNQAISA